jgi:hypothetical protein
MSKSNGKLTPAVAYIRMSSGKQEASPEGEWVEALHGTPVAMRNLR